MLALSARGWMKLACIQLAKELIYTIINLRIVLLLKEDYLTTLSGRLSVRSKV